MSSEISPDDLSPVSRFASRWPHLGTEASHRWNLFIHRQQLEEAGAVARRGRRIFLVVPNYLRWMTGRSGSGA